MKARSLALCLVATVAIASGSVITYNNAAAFTSAAGSLTTIEFGGALGGLSIVTLPSFSSDGVNFVGEVLSGGGSAPGVYVIGPNYYFEYDRDGFASIASFRRGTPSDMTITLPAGTRAVGFSIFSVTEGVPTSTDVEHIAVGGNTYDVTTLTYNGAHNGSDLAFFGFISNVPVASFTITGSNLHGNANFDLEHFMFGPGQTVGAVPEPGTLWGTGALLPLLAALRFRRGADRSA